MAVVNTSATAISNRDRPYVSGMPSVQNSALIGGGRVLSRIGTVAKAAGDSNNSVYRFCEIASAFRIVGIKVIADAIAGLVAVDTGIYDVAVNGGAVVAQDLFVTGADLHAGNTTPIEQRWVKLGAATAEQALWQLMGLSDDPNQTYDLCLTATTAGGNAGNLAVELLYIPN